MQTTRDQYINILKSKKDFLVSTFSVNSLIVFGSVARNEFSETSDIDIFVDMPAQMTLFVGVKQYLESLLHRSVDIIRNHKNLNPCLKEQIQKDGVTVFTA